MSKNQWCYACGAEGTVFFGFRDECIDKIGSTPEGSRATLAYLNGETGAVVAALKAGVAKLRRNALEAA